MRPAGRTQIALLAAEDRLVSRTKVFGALDERAIDIRLLPVQLVHRPDRCGRLGQRTNVRAVRSRALGERVPFGDEFARRQLIQAVEICF